MAKQALQTKEARPKRHLGKLLFLGLNFVLFLAGASFFALTKFGILGNTLLLKSAPTPQESQSVVKEKAPADAGPGIMLRFDPFIVNLSGDRGRRYLRLIMQVEVPDERAKVAVENRIPHLRDRLIFLLSSKTFADISSIEGKYRLREEILTSVNDLLGKATVKQVYFTEFIVQ